MSMMNRVKPFLHRFGTRYAHHALVVIGSTPGAWCANVAVFRPVEQIRGATFTNFIKVGIGYQMVSWPMAVEELNTGIR
jgi:hypothetical protein